ncbi:SapC family protein [Roseovarius sp. D22-M7]|uniref:SapC family protein n=1 Tax=Roseovarius sp. D22-M7 TaxID=3127116 RepID=UPI0030104C17
MTIMGEGSEGLARGIVPVRLDRHARRFWRRFSSWEFARAHRLVPIVLGEHEHVAATLPIVFAAEGAGPWPVALTRLDVQGACALVSSGGQWRGSYVPSILRVHPFTAQRDETDDTTLLVDEASGLVTDTEEDEPFFEGNGEPAAGLRQVMAFFHERGVAENRTRIAMSELCTRALLIPLQPRDVPPRMDVQGLFVPDRARIEALGRTDLGVLHRCGALALVQVQGVSMHHLPVLAAAEAQLDPTAQQAPSDTGAGTVTAGGDTLLSGFLDALAQSRDRDTDFDTPSVNEIGEDINQFYTSPSEH